MRRPSNELWGSRGSVLRGGACAIGLSFSLVGCGATDEPPGRSVEGPELATLPTPKTTAEAREEATNVADAAPSAADLEPGHGHKLASIAMRSNVYISPDYQSTKLGYLRAGAVVDRAAVPSGYKRCKGGFYRIHPRGYVCVGTGASLDVSTAIVDCRPARPAARRAFPVRLRDFALAAPAPLRAPADAGGAAHRRRARPKAGAG